MSLGTILIIAGILFAVAYVFKNPQILGRLSDILQTGQRTIDSAKRDMGMTDSYSSRPNSQESSVEDQVKDIKAGEFLRFDEGGNESVTAPEFFVNGVGTFQAQNRSGSTFTPQGVEYRVYFCDGLKIVERPEGWFAYPESEHHVLQGEGAKEFDKHGQIFGDAEHQQRPGSYSFTWREHQLSIIDTGYMLFKRSDGKCPIADGELVKYLLAETADGRSFLMMNLKGGSDGVWLGQALGSSLQGYVFDVLRASA